MVLILEQENNYIVCKIFWIQQQYYIFFSKCLRFFYKNENIRNRKLIKESCRQLKSQHEKHHEETTCLLAIHMGGNLFILISRF